VGKFLIPFDFVILDTNEDLPVPLILGLPFLATVEAVFDMPTDTMSFTMCGERVDFYFSLPMSLPTPSAQSAPTVPPRFSPPPTMSDVELGDWDGGLHMSTTVFPSTPPLATPHSRGPTWKDNSSWKASMTDFRPSEVLDAPPFHISVTSPLPVLPSSPS